MKILKTVLLEALGFFLLCVCGSVLGGFLFMLYGASTSYVVGSELNVFLPNTFLDGILICFPPIMLLVPMLRLLSLLRHESKSKLFGIITISVLSICTWFFCVPICARAVDESGAFEYKAPSELTPGYFRKINKEMHYFSAVRGNNVDGIKFENEFSNRNRTDRKVQIVKGEKIELKRDTYGFSDPIVGTLLEPPSVLSKFFFGLLVIEKSAFKACSDGLAKWIGFSSIMLALIAVAALLSVSAWRLVCMFWILFSTSAIIAMNYFYIDLYFSSFLSQLGYRGSFFNFIKNNFQFIMNGVFVIVLVLAGILCMLFREKILAGDDL